MPLLRIGGAMPVASMCSAMTSTGTAERYVLAGGMVRFHSTRGKAPLVGLSEGLVAGLAPDGGLYLPAELPQLPVDRLGRVESLAAAGQVLLAPFFDGDALAPHLGDIVQEAFQPPAPLVDTAEPRLRMLELFHGPTAAFKDFGAAFLAACLQRLAVERTTILVATSGDTGGAVAAAFHQRPWARVVVLYPEGKVSPRQAHQLESFGDNVVTLRVDGTFDDCQRLVKGAFANEALRRDVRMTSANSISLGRLLPQMVYHAHAATHVARVDGEAGGWIVPTGNLGNALAAWLVGAMGGPIRSLVMATNANRVLTDWLGDGDYRPRPSMPTLANAMDVGAPSNLERLVALLGAGVEGPRLHGLSVDDAAIGRALAVAPDRYGRVVCPHTACALVAFETLPVCRVGRWVAVATAHPAKFETVVEPRIGGAVPLPASLAELLGRPRIASSLKAEPAALEAVLRSEQGWL